MTDLTVRVGGLRYRSFDEGPGPRTVLFFAGCAVRCIGCHTPQLWSRQAGVAVTVEEAGRRLRAGRDLGDRGISFVGGEPTEQPEALAALCRLVQQEWPLSPSVPRLIVYSGHTFEALRARQDAAIEAALAAADVLIDGPFVAAQADANLGYRGSRNQRVIDLPETLRAGRVVTLDWDRPRITLTAGRIVTTLPMARRLSLPVSPARHCGELQDRRQEQ